MLSRSRELVFLLLQFLDDEKFNETVHKLEAESGVFFNMRYFEDAVTNGKYDEVEKYLSGFTKVDDNRYSMKIYFELRKQKYLEALDRNDHANAVEILVKDLKVFSTYNEAIVKDITLLLTLNNFRENGQLSNHGDAKSARAVMVGVLKQLIESNPLFKDKLQFPSLKNTRLHTLVNQSLNWQHQLCKNPRPNPDIKTILVDHTCEQANGVRTPSPVTNHLAGSIPKVGGFLPLGAPGPSQSIPAGFTAPLAGWVADPSSVAHQPISGAPMSLTPPSRAASLAKRPRTATDNPGVDYQTVDYDLLKRSRPLGNGDEVNNMRMNISPVTNPSQRQNQALNSTGDFPKTVVANINQGSDVKSMVFHPLQQSLLLVGTNIGDFSIWEVGRKERVVYGNFKVWNPSACSAGLQASLANEYTASVNRVAWSPDGALFGVAYSKHIVHIFSYHGGCELRNHLEIDAHAGNVSDLAFAHPNKQLCFVTCGEDKTIKVWDARTGSKLYTLEGHEAPVFSICPHHRDNTQA